jgi:hypothetical protein
VLAAVYSSGEEHPPTPQVSRKGAGGEPAPGLEPGTARLQVSRDAFVEVCASPVVAGRPPTLVRERPR